MSIRCKHDCFNCKFDDCVLPEDRLSLEERREIRERDNRYFNAIEAKGVVKQRPNRKRQRTKRRVVV